MRSSTELSHTKSLQASGVLSSDIDSVWGEVKHLIEPAIFENEFTLEEIYQSLKDRAMQLWVVWDIKIICACITRIEKSKNKKFLTILIVGGERMADWFDFIHVLQGFALSHECDELRVYGRKGWEKILSKIGFDNPMRMFRKKLYVR